MLTLIHSWHKHTKNIIRHKKWTKAYAGDRKWFAGGLLNTCYNCLDVNKGKGTALIYDSPVTNVKQSYTYDELLVLVKQFAGVCFIKLIPKRFLLTIFRY